MKLGVLLPTFRENVADALEVAHRAEALGLDGVFAYDHLWPMGEPQRPALAPFPVLTRVVTECPTLIVSPLVTRVGLFATAKVVEQYLALEQLAPGRVHAAIGTGDHLSAAENEAYGLTYQSAAARRELLRETLSALSPTMETWCGGGGEETNTLARALGVTINLWGAETKAVRKTAKSGPVSWAGPLGDQPLEKLNELASTGVTWVVVGPPFDLDQLGEWRSAH